MSDLASRVEQYTTGEKPSPPSVASEVKVYVLELGTHEDSTIAGVYATAEAAMAAHHPARDDASALRTYEWSYSQEFGWTFDGDWHDSAQVHERVLIS